MCMYACMYVCMYVCMYMCICVYVCRGKNFLKCSLVLRTSTPKFLLVLLPNNAGHLRKYNIELYFFNLSAGHWMKIYACPD